MSDVIVSHQPKTIQDVQGIVKDAGRLLPRGGGTKPALSTPSGPAEVFETDGLSGILEYQPEEYTFTALAGTSLQEISISLGERGQYLPFDPPLRRAGATLGGTVAAGLSGPGRYHYGGLRDFLLGVRFVDGQGQLVHGGGKVVKNAAGFDLPKLMVGGLGRFGIMVELSFKVLPRPAISTTWRKVFPSLDQALAMMRAASTARLDLDALEVWPDEEGCALLVRLNGLETTLAPRLARLENLLGSSETLEGEQEAAFWEEMVEFDWVPEGWSLVKMAVTPGRIPAIDDQLTQMGCLRRYSAGGQVAWIALEGTPLDLEDLVRSQGLNALALWGPPGVNRLGELKGRAFYERINSVLDPEHRFSEA